MSTERHDLIYETDDPSEVSYDPLRGDTVILGSTAVEYDSSTSSATGMPSPKPDNGQSRLLEGLQAFGKIDLRKLPRLVQDIWNDPWPILLTGAIAVREASTREPNHAETLSAIQAKTDALVDQLRDAITARKSKPAQNQLLAALGGQRIAIPRSAKQGPRRYIKEVVDERRADAAVEVLKSSIVMLVDKARELHAVYNTKAFNEIVNDLANGRIPENALDEDTIAPELLQSIHDLSYALKQITPQARQKILDTIIGNPNANAETIIEQLHGQAFFTPALGRDKEGNPLFIGNAEALDADADEQTARSAIYFAYLYQEKLKASIVRTQSFYRTSTETYQADRKKNYHDADNRSIFAQKYAGIPKARAKRIEAESVWKTDLEVKVDDVLRQLADQVLDEHLKIQRAVGNSTDAYVQTRLATLTRLVERTNALRGTYAGPKINTQEVVKQAGPLEAHRLLREAGTLLKLAEKPITELKALVDARMAFKVQVDNLRYRADEAIGKLTESDRSDLQSQISGYREFADGAARHEAWTAETVAELQAVVTGFETRVKWQHELQEAKTKWATAIETVQPKVEELIGEFTVEKTSRSLSDDHSIVQSFDREVSAYKADIAHLQTLIATGTSNTRDAGNEVVGRINLAPAKLKGHLGALKREAEKELKGASDTLATYDNRIGRFKVAAEIVSQLLAQYKIAINGLPENLRVAAELALSPDSQLDAWEGSKANPDTLEEIRQATRDLGVLNLHLHNRVATPDAGSSRASTTAEAVLSAAVVSGLSKHGLRRIPTASAEPARDPGPLEIPNVVIDESVNVRPTEEEQEIFDQRVTKLFRLLNKLRERENLLYGSDKKIYRDALNLLESRLYNARDFRVLDDIETRLNNLAQAEQTPEAGIQDTLETDPDQEAKDVYYKVMQLAIALAEAKQIDIQSARQSWNEAAGNHTEDVQTFATLSKEALKPVYDKYNERLIVLECKHPDDEPIKSIGNAFHVLYRWLNSRNQNPNASFLQELGRACNYIMAHREVIISILDEGEEEREEEREEEEEQTLILLEREYSPAARIKRLLGIAEKLEESSGLLVEIHLDDYGAVGDLEDPNLDLYTTLLKLNDKERYLAFLFKAKRLNPNTRPEKFPQQAWDSLLSQAEEVIATSIVISLMGIENNARRLMLKRDSNTEIILENVRILSEFLNRRSQSYILKPGANLRPLYAALSELKEEGLSDN